MSGGYIILDRKTATVAEVVDAAERAGLLSALRTACSDRYVENLKRDAGRCARCAGLGFLEDVKLTAYSCPLCLGTGEREAQRPAKEGA